MRTVICVSGRLLVRMFLSLGGCLASGQSQNSQDRIYAFRTNYLIQHIFLADKIKITHTYPEFWNEIKIHSQLTVCLWSIVVPSVEQMRTTNNYFSFFIIMRCVI